MKIFNKRRIIIIFVVVVVIFFITHKNLIHSPQNISTINDLSTTKETFVAATDERLPQQIIDVSLLQMLVTDDATYHLGKKWYTTHSPHQSNSINLHFNCDHCNPHRFRTLLSNPGLCSSSRRVPIVFLIHSRPEAFKQRRDIRNTWVAWANMVFAHAPRLFVVGKSLEGKINEDLRRESEVNGDILQEDFIDSYYNLTHKAIGGLKWISEFCSNAEFLFKVDDDVLINAKNLNEFIKHSDLTRPYIGCFHDTGRPHRNPKSKWFLSEIEYPPKLLPRFCYGFAVLYSMDAVVAIATATPNVRYFKLDDVYITGLVGTAHLGLSLTTLNGLDKLNDGGWCEFKRSGLARHVYEEDMEIQSKRTMGLKCR